MLVNRYTHYYNTKERKEVEDTPVELINADYLINGNCYRVTDGKAVSTFVEIEC